MKEYRIWVAIAIWSLPCLVWAQGSDSMRCGTRLLQKGDLAIQLIEKCGEPASKEVIGYTINSAYHYTPVSQHREYKIEQWVYGPVKGYYREVILEAGLVKRINRIKQ